jgi:hypothetical protein
MAHRGTECRNAVADVVRSFPNAKVVFGYSGGGHQVAHLEFNGRRAKQFFSCSPSCRMAETQVIRQTRKILRELSCGNDPIGQTRQSRERVTTR